jgi:hypothetical protein
LEKLQGEITRIKQELHALEKRRQESEDE